jgi:hypothetical protein
MMARKEIILLTILQLGGYVPFHKEGFKGFLSKLHMIQAKLTFAIAAFVAIVLIIYIGDLSKLVPFLVTFAKHFGHLIIVLHITYHCKDILQLIENPIKLNNEKRFTKKVITAINKRLLILCLPWTINGCHLVYRMFLRELIKFLKQPDAFAKYGSFVAEHVLRNNNLLFQLWQMYILVTLLHSLVILIAIDALIIYILILANYYLLELKRRITSKKLYNLLASSAKKKQTKKEIKRCVELHVFIIRYV